MIAERRVPENSLTIIGVDEAGVGPRLGPFVVSASVFRTHDGSRCRDLWEKLSHCVTRESWLRRFKVLVDDSKVLYTPARGLEELEENILSFAGVSAGPTARLDDLLAHCCIEPCQLDHYPWYDVPSTALPLACVLDRVVEKRTILEAGLAEAGIGFSGIRTYPVFEREFNDHIRTTRNKARTLFELTARLLHDVIDRTEGDIEVICDRQGGRAHYVRPWQQAFPGSTVRVLEEGSVSRYKIYWQGRRIEVVFAEKADGVYMPVALASMMSKYIREVFMHQLNGFWRTHLPEVKPTAGYPSDWRRFVDEVRDAKEKLGISDHLMIRTR